MLTSYKTAGLSFLLFRIETVFVCERFREQNTSEFQNQKLTNLFLDVGFIFPKGLLAVMQTEIHTYGKSTLMYILILTTNFEELHVISKEILCIVSNMAK